MKNNKPRDLSQTNGTYTKLLNENIQTIYDNYNNRSISVEQFKQKVIKIIESAHDTPAKIVSSNKSNTNFLLSLNKQKTKNNVLFFVSNSWLRGCGLSSNINDKFNV